MDKETPGTKISPAAVPGSEADIRQELIGLQECLKGVWEDLSSLSPDATPGVHLPAAQGELGAVMATTANAANSILDACLVFEDAIRKSELQGDERVTRSLSTIYEACSFQDLTGQRISKVRRLLSGVEEKLASLLGRLGIDRVPAKEAVVNISDDRSLMNGPAMPGNGMNQANIDAMFD